MTGPVKRRFPKSAKPAPAVTRASIVNARKPPPVPKTSSAGPSAAPKASPTVPPAAPTTSSSGLPADFFDSPSAPSSKLPSDFFDSSSAPSAKRVRTDGNDQKTLTSASPVPEPDSRNSNNYLIQETETRKTEKPVTPSQPVTPSAGNDVASGIVPEGFFDNVDADHRARGLEPPKVDIKEEYKEFQKSIKSDLVAADVQQEEDEEEAADIREEYEVIEQRSLRERVDILRKAKEERVAKVKAESVVAFPAAMGVDDDDDSEDDEEDDDDIAYDWRAKEI